MTESKNTQQQKKFKVLLIGDNCIDEYQYGIIDRISPEAPVPVFVPMRKETRPGMASNVFQNLKNLGCEVTCHFSQPSVKTRLIEIKSNQQVLRIDNDKISEPFQISKIQKNNYDAIVISDYNKGFVSYELIENLRSNYSCPIFVDTKKNELEKFNGCILKINEKEYNLLKNINDNCIVTLGENGAMHLYKGQKICYDAIKIDVMDVCGAGDTFLASLTYSFLSTNDMNESIKFALKAASITIRHIGVYAPTIEEINAT